MAILKCKMCGDNIEVSVDKTYGTCDSCGSTMTLPKIDSDQRANLFNRANRFRQIGEFDKAISAYESILNQDDTDAEAHWCVVLSRFGIEYVVDPASGKRIPTCHRLQTSPILGDADYLAALEHTTDTYTRELYQQEANRIAEIQKDIMAISASEAPYDIFICYKESDENGNRTKDSAMAQEVYYQLINEGFNVFFARISLEDKLGTAYEPYIFAALHSAKVMIVVGSTAEYFNAVWVKNEWSRYLDLMSKDKSRLLIPCYRDMDAYDIPDALSLYQSQEMGKIGFIQDLVRGVRKVLVDKQQSSESQKPILDTTGMITPALEALLKRGYIFLEDKDWEQAETYFNRALDLNPECAEAYIGLVCMSNQLPKMECLGELGLEIRVNNSAFSRFGGGDAGRNYVSRLLERPITHHTNMNSSEYAVVVKHNNNQSCYIDPSLISTLKTEEELVSFLNLENQILHEDKNYQKALKFATAQFRNQLTEWGSNVKKRKTASCYAMLDRERSRIDEALSFYDLGQVYRAFGEYSDAPAQAQWCHEQYLECSYQDAINEKNHAQTPEDYATAIEWFEALGDYKDANGQIAECQKQMEVLSEQKVQDEARAQRLAEEICLEKVKQAKAEGKRRRIGAIITTLLIAAVVIAFAAYSYILQPMTDYTTAMELLSNNQYAEATIAFAELGNYKDSVDQIAISRTRWVEEQAQSISAGLRYTVALKNDGTVLATGENILGQCSVADWIDIVAISATQQHTVGLKSDGTVVAVGNNEDGQCNVTDWTDIVAISTGSAHTVGLKSDGTVVAVGSNSSGRCDVEYWTDIVAISAYDRHTIGLKSDGTVVAVGDNYDSQCEVDDWTDIVAISTGDSLTMGLKSDGTVVTTGDIDTSDWSNIMTVSVGDRDAVGIKTDGSIVSVNDSDFSEWSDIIAVSSGYWHTIGLKSDGTLITTLYAEGLWDEHDKGQCNVAHWSDIMVYEN